MPDPGHAQTPVSVKIGCFIFRSRQAFWMDASVVRSAVCGRLILIFCVVTLFFAGAHAAPAPLGAGRHFGYWLERTLRRGWWLDSCGAILRVSSSFSGERDTGIAPRLPHPGEAPRTPSVPTGTFVVSPFASLGIGQGRQSASVWCGGRRRMSAVCER
jgi:hypothetical protein